MNRFASRALVTSVILAAATAWATQPQHWVHQTQDDFSPGAFENTTLTSQGELVLGRAMTNIEFNDAMEFITSFVQDSKGRVFFATAPTGKVYRIDGDKAVEYYAPADGQEAIWSLGLDAKGNVLASITGDSPRLVKLMESADGQKVNAVKIFDHDDVHDVWSIVTAADGTLYLATGPNGAIWSIPVDGKPVELLRLGSKNILSLSLDKDGNLIAGTAGDGLVIRVDVKTKKTFVLLDAGESDITALLPDGKGSLFVAVAKPGANSDLMSGGSSDADSMDLGKSKPGKPEPESMDAADMNEPPPAAKKTTTQSAASQPANTLPAHVNPAPNIPADIRKLIEQAQRRAKASSNVKKDKQPSPNAPNRPSTTKRANSKKINRPIDHDSDSTELRGVYQISADGVVTPVFENETTVYSLSRQQNQILIGTGTAGKLYAYDPATETTSLLARLTDESITSMVATTQGQVFVGTSNAGGIYRLAADIAETGTFTSDVLDAKHVAAWGSANLNALIPAGADVTIAARSSNVRDSEEASEFWSEWSPELKANGYVAIPSPSARFMQYRVTLRRGENNASPVVQDVNIAYQTRNLPPKLTNVRAEHVAADEENEGAPRPMQITWDAEDPNGDQMAYRIYYRKAGNQPWVPLAKDIKETNHSWDTRSLKDGKYQIQVVATDAADNSAAEAKTVAQITPSIIVDNTPPAISDVTAKVEGHRVVITGKVKDAVSTISELRAQIGTQQDWQLASASDKIFDSPSEEFRVETRALPAGTHKITLKAVDSAGNTAFDTVVVQVPSDEGKK